MRILFAHDSSAPPTALLARVRYLSTVPGVEVETVFAREPRERELFAQCGPTSTADARRFRELIAASKHDALVIIDGETYLEAARGKTSERASFVEIHSGSAANLRCIETLRPTCDAFVVPSRFAKRTLHERRTVPSYSAVEIAPISVDPKVFFPAPSPEAKRPILGWVGDLDDPAPWKTLLLLTSLVVEGGADIDLWAVGGEGAKDSSVDAFLESVDGLDLSSRVRWFPRIEHGSMRRFYALIAQSGGCLLSTSTSELFGLSITEAMFCQCRVAAPDTGANGEIAPGSPFLRLYHEIEDAARAVGSLLGAPRMAESDVAEIRSRFGPEHLGPPYLAMIVRMVEAKRFERT